MLVNIDGKTGLFITRKTISNLLGDKNAANVYAAVATYERRHGVVIRVTVGNGSNKECYYLAENAIAFLDESRGRLGEQAVDKAIDRIKHEMNQQIGHQVDYKVQNAQEGSFINIISSLQSQVVEKDNIIGRISSEREAYQKRCSERLTQIYELNSKLDLVEMWLAQTNEDRSNVNEEKKRVAEELVVVKGKLSDAEKTICDYQRLLDENTKNVLLHLSIQGITKNSIIQAKHSLKSTQVTWCRWLDKLRSKRGMLSKQKFMDGRVFEILNCFKKYIDMHTGRRRSIKGNNDHLFYR